jgi:spore germination protein
MIIHVVQPGETINSISEMYHIPAERLILENGIVNPDRLVVGQTIVIVPAETVYTVKEGDTLESIAENNGITLMELLRNNPYLSDRTYIYPGETLVIRYETVKSRTISTSGYTFYYIDKNTLRKTLPFLTYLNIFNYQVTIEGNIITQDDTEIIQLAKEYGVAPIMFVSSYTAQGVSSKEVVYTFFRNPEALEQLTKKCLDLLRSRGFYGINLYIEHINVDNIDLISKNLEYVASIFHSEGYRVVLTVTPEFIFDEEGVIFEPIDYSSLSSFVDAIVFASYEFGNTYGYPSSFIPVNMTKNLLDSAVTAVPPEKIYLGLITLGYDWPVPYVIGVSRANAITTNSAIQIAAEYGIAIQFNEDAQAPYFFYYNGETRLIWFKDARTMYAVSELVREYSLRGLSIWTIMDFNPQMWFIFNNQYEIEKIPDIT